MSEQNNDGAGIEAATNAGSFEGSVSAEAPGNIGSDLSGIEANMSVNNGGGVSDPSAGPQMGTLDLDPNVIGAPVAVMDSRVDDPAPTFIASVTGADAKALASAVILGGAAVAAVLSGGATAGPLLGMAILNAGTNLEAIAHATMDAQQSLGMPGAFASWEMSVEDFTAPTETAIVPLYDGWGGFIGMGPPPVQDYWSYMGIG